MKRPGFFEGVAVAAIASLAGGACYVALTTLFSSTAVLRFVVAGLALAYITYLLSRNEERVGRITVIALWLPAACVLWFIEPSFAAYICAHLALVWLVRSLSLPLSLVAALADLASSHSASPPPCGPRPAPTARHSVSGASSSCRRFTSPFPRAWRRAVRAAKEAAPEDRFQHAHRAAEAALRRLHSIR
jgi:hypothetical protein